MWSCSRSKPSANATSQAFWNSAFSMWSPTFDCCQSLYSFTAISQRPGTMRGVIGGASDGRVAISKVDTRGWWGGPGSMFVILIGGRFDDETLVAFWCLSSRCCSSAYNCWWMSLGMSLWVCNWLPCSMCLIEGFRSLGLKLDYKFWFSGGIKAPWHADHLPVLADD